MAEWNMWDDRFAGESFLFGTEPADFLKAQADQLPARSKVLCVADGEGRNSVYLAGLGHDVTAFDASSVGVEKARGLAGQAGVLVDFHVAGADDWDWTQSYDAVVAIFIQFAPPDMRKRLFARMAQAIRPGGYLLLHGYAPRQVSYGTGGPPDAENMYTKELLREEFGEFKILRLDDYDTEIDEGPGHSGMSALVDLVARKSAV